MTLLPRPSSQWYAQCIDVPAAACALLLVGRRTLIVFPALPFFGPYPYVHPRDHEPDALPASPDSYSTPSSSPPGIHNDAISAQILGKTLETMQLGVTITDTVGRIIYTNPAEARMHGYTVDELMGRDVRVLAPPTHAKPLPTQQMHAMNSWSRETLNVRKDGSVFPVVLRSDVVKDAEGAVLGIVTCCEDVTQRRAMERQLLQNAFYDPLTSLPNRGLFLHRLQAAVERRSVVGSAVFVLGIDGARLIHESLGHEAEEELIVLIGKRLQEAIRSDTLVARIGGNLFAVLLEDSAGLFAAAHLAQRLLAALDAPFSLRGREVFSRASVGIALTEGRHEAPDEILRDAMLAMHRSRENSSAYEVFDEAMHAEAVARLHMEADLRRALERGELRVHYQPIVMLESGRIAGFEALARWDHPDLGTIPPDRFIPLAEETGLIVPLGLWILREACGQIIRLQRDGCGDAPLSIAVNLSVKQLAQPSLVPSIVQILQDTGVDPARLKLEITESVLMQHSEEITHTVSQLRDLGIQFYIDDFGTGYSSLSYLHRLPLAALKIDRSFVNELHTSGGLQLVRAIIALAHALGVMVVTEGVEDAELLAELRSLGCEYAQGYFFSHPVDGIRAEQLCAEDPQW